MDAQTKGLVDSCAQWKSELAAKTKENDRVWARMIELERVAIAFVAWDDAEAAAKPSSIDGGAAWIERVMMFRAAMRLAREAMTDTTGDR